MRNIPFCMGTLQRALVHGRHNISLLKMCKNKIFFIAVLFSVFVAAAFSGALWASTTPQIAAGGGHTVALKSDGTVCAWGANS